MPTANSAVRKQPTSSLTIQPTRSLRNLALGFVLSVATVLPAGLLIAPAISAVDAPEDNCRRWTSTTHPPDYIRVLRRSGRIQNVPFRRYVVTVMGKEWPSYLPQAVVEAGAVAVKQYAWYHVLRGPRHTRNGRCFDVRDGTSDQLYKPQRARVRADHHAAVEKTWNITLLKGGRMFMTGYRRGERRRCGRDRTGWKLFARSATRCANSGKGYLKILRIYYGPDLEIITRSS